MSDTEDADRRFQQEVSRKEVRKLRARRRSMRTVWYGFGMFGMVGWSVAVPTLIGLAVGIWLDRRVERPYSFTLMGLVAGVAAGCYLAWYWISRESAAAQAEDEDDIENNEAGEGSPRASAGSASRRTDVPKENG
ncbi:MAG TPA: F0F1 ATP synthase subunit [Planctomycetaceae bacterium]|nr:F0F1 ATP synthase subunit [Planctomycetaceae bacterium]